MLRPVRRALIAVGLPACAALLTGAITFVVYSYAEGEPPDGADLSGALVFGVLSLVLVLLALRGSKTRAAPILLFVGALAGATVSVLMCRERFESIADSRAGYCREYLANRANDQAIVVCLTEVKSCDARFAARRRAPPTIR